jgi:putative phosphoesterase
MYMRVAAIYDLHGNLPALEAVLEDIHQAEIDLLVVGGDLVPGPMARETIELLLDLNIPTQFIQGNGEIDALTHLSGKSLDRVPEQYRDIVEWSAEQLYPKYEKLLASWAKTLSFEIAGIGKVLFCHATPRDDNEIFTRQTPEELLLPIFEGIDVNLIVCGHTHMRFDRMIGKIRVVNSGSLGMPFGEPVANWLLLGKDIQFRKTSYDLEKAAERIRNTNYPQAEEFAATSILNPPSEELMLEIFSKAKLR